jgi:hypothetical protein
VDAEETPLYVGEFANTGLSAQPVHLPAPWAFDDTKI